MPLIAHKGMSMHVILGIKLHVTVTVNRKDITYQEVSRFFADDQRIVFFLCDIDQRCLRDNETQERIVRRVCYADNYQNIVSYR